MKRTVLWLCLFLCLCLPACGKGNDAMKEASGTYKLSKSKLVGDNAQSWKSDDDFSRELKSDGTGTSSRDGMEIKVKWALTEEEFTMTETYMGMSIEYTGTMKNGELDVFNGDPEDIWTCEFVYVKQDKTGDPEKK